MIDDSQKANVVPIGTSQSKSSPAQQASSARARMARLPAPVHRVREKSAALLQQTLKTLFDGADDALFDLADRATSNQDQNTYFEAMREVRLKRRETELAFFTRLDEGFADLLKPVAEHEEVFATDISLDELTLVDNDQLEFQVAVESMVAKVFERCAEPAQHIALRLDSLVPAKVYQQNNPVGPDRLCNNFWKVIEPLDVDIKAKLVLLKLFDKAVMAQLHKIYVVLNNLLIQQNVLPSLASRAQRRPAQRTTAARAQTASSGAGAPEQSQVLEQLRGLLSGGNDAGASVLSGAASGSGSGLDSVAGSVLPVNELAQVLTSLQQRTPQATEGQAGLLNNQQLLNLIKPATQSGASMSAVDQDVMNLINMLFQFILDDRNLAPAMQGLLARLQIPLLKVAVVDKSFFNKAGHPARRLLNELATAALGWQEPEKGAQKDPLFRKVSAVVESVINEFESDVTLFENLLTDFIAFTEKEKRRAQVLEQRTLDAEDGKAKTEQARALVSEALRQIIQERPLPESVAQIVDGPWHNVLFLILLKHGQDSDEWRDACDLVEKLVWSVTTRFDADNRSELMGLLPKLLSRLREGFELISYNPFEMNTLLKKLEQEHLMRLRAPAKSSGPVAKSSETITSQASGSVEKQATNTIEPSEKRSVKAEAVAAKPSPASEVVKKVSKEVQAKEQVVKAEPEQKAELSPEEPIENQSPETAASASWLEQVDRFAQGSWFEVSEADKPAYRCRLAAVIKSVDKYIFVNRNGMKVAEKNREQLALALENGSFNILDDGMLFDRALESVIGNLRQSRGKVG